MKVFVELDLTDPEHLSIFETLNNGECHRGNQLESDASGGGEVDTVAETPLSVAAEPPQPEPAPLSTEPSPSIPAPIPPTIPELRELYKEAVSRNKECEQLLSDFMDMCGVKSTKEMTPEQLIRLQSELRSAMNEVMTAPFNDPDIPF